MEQAQSFMQGYDAKAFHGDERTRWAVYSQIIVIGEAAGRISREFQAQHSEIPWSDIIGMRHRLVHGYDKVRWDRVWDAVVNDFPMLKAAIEPLIPQEPRQQT